MFPSDAAAEPFKSDSEEREKTTKARGQTDENQGSRDGFSTREGGRHGQGDGIITGWKSKRY